MPASLPTGAHRRSGWTILIVPPRPDRRTRSFRLRRRHLKLAGSFFATVLIGTVALFAVISVTHSEQQAQLADAEVVIEELTDSLRALRESAAGAAALAATAGSPTSVASASTATRRSRRATTTTRRRSDVGLAQPAPGVVLPVIGRISSRFARSRFHPLLHVFRPHHGVDLSAPSGTAITAPAAGVVKFAGRKVGHGLVVELDHGDGVVSSYSHCKSINVNRGDVVSAGQVIAAVGRTGLATAPHVHFEVRVNGRPVDPLSYMISPRTSQPAALEPPGGDGQADARPTLAPSITPQQLGPQQQNLAPVQHQQQHQQEQQQDQSPPPAQSSSGTRGGI